MHIFPSSSHMQRPFCFCFVDPSTPSFSTHVQRPFCFLLCRPIHTFLFNSCAAAILLFALSTHPHLPFQLMCSGHFAFASLTYAHISFLISYAAAILLLLRRPIHIFPSISGHCVSLPFFFFCCCFCILDFNLYII